MRKKVLIIGNSASAYALAKRMSEVHEIFVAPANPIFKEFAEIVDIREDSVNELLEYAVENSIDLTVSVSIKAILSDIAEVFSANNQKILAPDLKAGNLIQDKPLTKKILYKLRVPTPKFGIFEKNNMAYDYIKNIKKPFVIKTNDPSSAVVLNDTKVGRTIIDSISARGQKIIIEDYIWGTPFAFYALTDGYKALPFGSSIIYKHSLEGDGGQLTSGMGSCVPNYKLSIDNECFLMENVIYPTLDYLHTENTSYTGVLGVNGILTQEGDIFVLGYNSFMQDCDCAGIISLISSDLYQLFESCADSSFSDDIDYIATTNAFAVSLTARCTSKAAKNNTISGLELIDEDINLTLYPSVTKNKYLEYEAQTGSVLTLTAVSSTASASAKKVYNNINNIDFKGISYRNDICKPLSAALC